MVPGLMGLFRPKPLCYNEKSPGNFSEGRALTGKETGSVF